VEQPILDLRGGASLWEAGNHRRQAAPLGESLSADIVIIGAGITGSFIAERLSRSELSIVLLDRNQPQSASTAASTALLLWAVDNPLRELAQRIGFENAAQVYQTNVTAVAGILDLVRELEIPCQFGPRPSLYLAGNKLGFSELADEQRMRERAGIGSALVSSRDLAERFGFQSEGALYDKGCAEADPVALARGLLDAAVRRGVKVFSPVLATTYDVSRKGVTVLTDAGHEIGARHLVLANGYEMPAIVPSSIHRIMSTWVVATLADAGLDWPDGVLVWEASEPYAYMRRTMDGRIIIGGEDEGLTDGEARDRKIGAKSERLMAKLGEFRPRNGGAKADYAWAGFFGTTDDGLPLIGPVPGHPNVHAAFGYGGNGITSSAIAARLMPDSIAGRRTALLDRFALQR